MRDQIAPEGTLFRQKVKADDIGPFVDSYIKATDAEVIEAARNIEGAIEAHLPDIAMYAEDNIVVPAGNYLVVRLDTLETQ